MRYVVNRMTLADIPRVIEIEKLAYSSTWPASSYRKELQDNPLAHYVVEREPRCLPGGQRWPVRFGAAAVSALAAGAPAAATAARDRQHRRLCGPLADGG